uniref:Uncharacterized protein n=1 Tax=Anopheles albimanus TaxID=7167 RepID=A0A182FEV1_ANOAL
MANLHHHHHHHPALHQRHRPFCGVDRQLRKIEEIFSNQKENEHEVKIIESRTSRHCSVHGSHRRGSVCSVKRRDSITSSIGDLSSVAGSTGAGKRASYGSIYNVGREAEMAARRRSRLGNRNSIANFSDLQLQYGGAGSRRNLTGVGVGGRRDSMPAAPRSLEHPAGFPSMLRATSVSTVDLRRKPSIGGSLSTGPGVTRRASMNNNNNNNNSSKRRSLNLDDSLSSAKLHSILKKASASSKDSEDSGEHDALCDMMTKRLSFDSGIAKLPPAVLANNRRNSNDSSSYSSVSRRISIDSLDAGRRYSRRLSDASSLFGGDEDAASSGGSTGGASTGTANDLDRIKVLNSSFASSFDRETSDHEVIH